MKYMRPMIIRGRAENLSVVSSEVTSGLGHWGKPSRSKYLPKPGYDGRNAQKALAVASVDKAR